jgi:hypothetical protein
VIKEDLLLNNCIITGLHRSGTTLICHLLNRLPNVVALDEPMDVSKFRNASKSQIIDTLHAFFLSQRNQIQLTKQARSKSMGGIVPPNQLSDISESGVRISVVDSFIMDVTNVSTENFHLYVKHPAVFTAMLPLLEKHFPCVVSIRNPLSILLSWMNTDFAVSRGRAPAAEMIDIDLKKKLDSHDDILDRQIILLNYFFERYTVCEEITILRYEDIVSSSGHALSSIEANALHLNEDLTCRNKREISSNPKASVVAEKLLNSNNACWNYYSHSDILELFS